MNQDELISKIESILFVSSKPVNIKQLAKLLEQEEDTVKKAIETLSSLRKESGVVVLVLGDAVQMATNGENVEIVNTFLNSDLREKLTDATVEVLGIIAYRQPISRAEIEAIRGVNSQYSVRHLLMRGLIEKAAGTESRAATYQVTTEFLQHFGLQSIKDLPDFESLAGQIKLPETVEKKVQEAPTQPVLPEPPKPTLIAEETKLPSPLDTPEISAATSEKALPTPTISPLSSIAPKISSEDISVPKPPEANL